MDVAATVAVVWKQESARIVAGLLRLVHDVGLAEELAQDALVAALEQWPAAGVPDNPAAWLTTTAKRRAIDHLRRSERLSAITGEVPQQPEEDPDDVLRLMFISCHPALSAHQRVALTLRVIAGLAPAEIARAFLVTEPEIVRRIAAAKRTLAESGAAYDLPSGDELRYRLTSVLEVVYAVFNEGYSASSGDDLMRLDLCLEALRLGRLLAALAPDEDEVHGLVALMEIQQSRSAARTGPSGEPIPLHEQNRGLWDRLLIERGFAAMLRARSASGRPGVYVLQAAIAVCHAQARTAEDTDWVQIATLYEALVRLLPTPVVQLNRAVARSFAFGPADGLAVVDTLGAEETMKDYHLLPGVRGDLLQRLGRVDEARFEFERAASLAGTAAERDFLRRRAAAPPSTGPLLGAAVDEFVAGLSAATARAYGQTLLRVRRALGDRLPLSALTAQRVAGVFATTWSAASARSWNRHRAAVRSFASWAGLPEVAA
jgi:RNA polymerase sigma factor (sigma-70 family)